MSGFKICTHLADVGEGLVVTVEEAVGLRTVTVWRVRLRHVLPSNPGTHHMPLSGRDCLGAYAKAVPADGARVQCATLAFNVIAGV